jgi:hypothetical protein
LTGILEVSQAFNRYEPSRNPDPLQAFHNRLACVQVVDPVLGMAYVNALRAYAAQLAEGFDDIDPWSVEEHEQVCEFLSNNGQWITHAEAALEVLATANAISAAHRQFPVEHGASEESLVRAPNPSYRHHAGVVPEFVRRVAPLAT